MNVVSCKRLTALFAVLAIAGLVVAGCGGDDDDGGGGQSKEDYVAAVETVCEETDKKLNDLGEPQSTEELAALATEAGSLFDEALAEIRALEPPDDEAFAADVDAYIDDVEAYAARFEDIQQAAEAGDNAKMRELAADSEAENGELDKTATSLGLDGCVSD